MLERISDYLSNQLDIPRDEINEDTAFESLGIDSLDMVEMIMELEAELDVSMDINDKITTVGELVEYIESKL